MMAGSAAAAAMTTVEAKKTQAAERGRNDIMAGDISNIWAAAKAVKPPELLPLNRGGRFGTDIENHAPDAADLVGNPTGNPLQQVVRQFRPIGGHGIGAFDRADRDDVIVRSLVAENADGLHGKE